MVSIFLLGVGVNEREIRTKNTEIRGKPYWKLPFTLTHCSSTRKSPALQNLIAKTSLLIKGERIIFKVLVCVPREMGNTFLGNTSLAQIQLCLWLNQKVAVLQLSDVCDRKGQRVCHKSPIKLAQGLIFSVPFVMTGMPKAVEGQSLLLWGCL